MSAMTLLCCTAYAGPFESLVMPGPVIEGHADIEEECGACHQKFDRGRQNALCLDCHEAVNADVVAGAGFHGRDPQASSASCASCHTDHEGRDATIVVLEDNAFDHRFTDFELLGKHADTACTDCHESDATYRDAPTDCASCHGDDDAHEGFLGDDCASCHAVTEWLDTAFDHEATGYPLIGKHETTACLDCHADATYQGAPTTCYGCHQADDVHEGRSGEQCDRCHNPADWADTSFDHARDTQFALAGGHADLGCDGCHSADPFADRLQTTCLSCHAPDDAHDGHFGESCDTCHTDVAWDPANFDHVRDTGYALNGAHRDADCESCHVKPVFETALATDCYGCHAAEDVHDGQEGKTCDTCHNETSWLDNVQFDHDLARFPLLGEHAALTCDACHETQAFRDAPMACNDCHADDDPHAARFDAQCERCHTPVEWMLWQFDHDRETAFALAGAHVAVGCDDCHRRPLDAMRDDGASCGSCHRADDVHDGDFGDDCGRCHSADTFTGATELR